MSSRTKKHYHTRDQRGLSIFELVFAIAIFGLLVSAIAAFQIYVFSNSKTGQARSEVDQKVITTLRNFTKELRSAQASNTGSYPLEKTDDRELIFYSDLRNDGLVDRIRYFVSGQTLKRGTLIPTGSPLVYNVANEVIASLIPNLVGNDPIFIYNSSTYNGVSSITALTQPVNIQEVRYIQMPLVIDTKAPKTIFIHVTSSAEIRNLKDN